jgi:hypothetical protein
MTHASVLRKAVQTKIHFSATSLDQLPHHLTSYSLYGHQSLIPVPDIDHSSYMLIIGGNPLASNGSIMTSPDIPKRLKAIQQRGGRFIVIDPRRTETAEIADQHLFIRPGTDAWLLMAMLNTLFAEDLVSTGHLTDLLVGVDQVRSACASFTPELAEQRTGVAAEQIRQLARDMASIEGAVCYGRMGVSVQVYGTLCQWAIQMINILTSSMDVRGGMIASSPAFGFIKPGESGAGHFAAFHSRVSGLPEFAGELPATVMAEEMLTEGEGQIRGLITTLQATRCCRPPMAIRWTRHWPVSTLWYPLIFISMKPPGMQILFCRPPVPWSTITMIWPSIDWRCTTRRALMRLCLNPPRAPSMIGKSLMSLAWPLPPAKAWTSSLCHLQIS